MATKAKKVAVRDLLQLRVPAWYHTYRQPDRPGSMDAFKLPSVINGSAVYPKARPAAELNAEVL